jgi:hypothetical protein
VLIRTVKKICECWCSILLLPLGAAGADEIHGRVTGADGSPIQGARVQAVEMGGTHTDSTGRYVLNSMFPIRVVWFHAEGYQPMVQRKQSSVDVLNARLQPNGATFWHIPICQDVARLVTGRSLGIILTGEVRDGGVVHAPDVVAHRIDLQTRGKPYHADLTFVGLVDSWPGETRYANSRTFAQRTWVSDATLTGFDAHGVFNDGTYWRSIGLYSGGESLEYAGVPKEVAAVFDLILDSVCVVRK